MKKRLAFCLAALLMIQSVSLHAEETPISPNANIEIMLRVGEDTLKINGTDVKVEKPFVENGTTLVPLRVITEAFGAEVVWDGDTKQITLNYKDVTILLKIDDINAYVNGQQQTLLLAPRIVNGNTMVPLRFITENFGAEVAWNDTDNSVLVTLVNDDGEISDISSALQKSNKPKIGDSFYKWSMDMPPYMTTYYKSFDRMSITIESDDDDVSIDISISENKNKESLANLKVKESKSMQWYTMTGQETKKTASGVSYICTQGKSKSYLIDRKVYIKGDNIFTVETNLDSEISKDDRQKYFDISNSFDFLYDNDATEDLSNIKDGMRLFEEKDLNVEIRVPSDWDDYGGYNSKFNTISFRNSNYEQTGSLTLDVYSIEKKSCSTWASEEYTYYKNLYNPKLVDFTEVKTGSFGNASGYYYTINLKQKSGEIFVKNMFFYYEGYAYNLSISVPNDKKSIVDTITKSLKVSKIDPEEAGTFSMPDRGTDDVLTTYENKTDKYKISVPSSWTRYYDNSSYIDNSTSSYITIRTIKPDESIDDYIKEISASREVKVISDKLSNKIKNEEAEYIYYAEIFGNGSYLQVNIFKVNGTTFISTALMSELYFCQFNQNKIYKILNSIEAIK